MNLDIGPGFQPTGECGVRRRPAHQHIEIGAVLSETEHQQFDPDLGLWSIVVGADQCLAHVNHSMLRLDFMRKHSI